MRKPAIVPVAILMLVAACSPSEAASSTTTASNPSSTTSSTVASPSTTTPIECPVAPYALETLPTGVGRTALDPDLIDPDVWTSVPGSSSRLWGRGDGTVAIALIRGTLPAVDWPGEKGQVLIDGTRAAVGPHADGTWVAGWYEAPGERCDLYTMVFYPAVAPDEVEAVLEGMNRVGG
jgi:hypothetical protein